jgi:hypothetical protein
MATLVYSSDEMVDMEVEHPEIDGQMILVSKPRYEVYTDPMLASFHVYDRVFGRYHWVAVDLQRRLAIGCTCYLHMECNHVKACQAYLNAPVAQGIEHLPSKQTVGGSIPSRCTILVGEKDITSEIQQVLLATRWGVGLGSWSQTLSFYYYRGNLPMDSPVKAIVQGVTLLKGKVYARDNNQYFVRGDKEDA